MDTLHKTAFISQVRQNRATDFIILLRMAYNIKFMSFLFVEFFIYYFWTDIDHV
jgi:hypothetical protein